MQATESAALSLAKFWSRAHFPSTRKPSSRPPRRVITDALKTVYWTYGVSAAFNDEDYKALERRFAPHSAACNKVDPVFTNLWLGYFLGRHRPTRILAAVERAHPGANECLRSPLWPALTDRQLTRSQINKLLQQLEPEIRDVVWANSQIGRAGAKQAAMLELRARLDALAAEILLLRLAHLDGRHEAAFQWSRHVWRMMVLLGPALMCGGIAQAMADLLEERIMPMARREGTRFGFPPGHYLEVVSKFVFAIHRAAKGSPKPKTERQLLRIGQDLLGFKWGFGYFWAFNPVPLLDDGVQLAALVEFDLASEHLNLHRWGLNMHNLGSHRNEPPDAASSGENLWAIDPDDPYVHWVPEPFRAD